MRRSWRSERDVVRVTMAYGHARRRVSVYFESAATPFRGDPVVQGRGDWLRVTYLVRASAGDIAARAEALMLEQAVELPRAMAARDAWVAAHMLGRVEQIESAGDGAHRVTIGQPL